MLTQYSLPLTRRQFLTASSGTVAVLALPGLMGRISQAGTQPKLHEPRLRQSKHGLLQWKLRTEYEKMWIGNTRVFLRSYWGRFPGPTFRVRPGDTFQLRLVNDLPPDEHPMHGDMNIPHGFNTTNMHLHGLHISPKGNSDNVLLEIPPGERFDFEYHIPANHPAGTYWYHPHKHGATAIQLLSGMSGALIIEGDIDEVPEIAAARERLFVLQEIRVNDKGLVPDFDLDAFDNATVFRTINGQLQPYLSVRPGEVQRWRFVQAGASDFSPIQLDHHSFHQIAFDGISFPQPREVDSIMLANGNRADVLVKGGAPGVYYLRKLAYDQGLGVVPEAVLATVIVQGEPVNMPLPTGLPTPSYLTPIPDQELTGARTLVFDVQENDSGLQFVIDGQPFSPDRVDQTVNLGAVEEWTLLNNSPGQHPFHIHVNPFQVTHINGQPVALQIWQDTVIIPQAFTGTDGSTIPGSVTLRSRFTDFDGKFVLHCHILPHEDLGMMQIVAIAP